MKTEKRSNRTFMELKFAASIVLKLSVRRSNRTFMELKLTRFSALDLPRTVLIVPLWN